MSRHSAGWILLFVLYATFEHPFVNGQSDETNLENGNPLHGLVPVYKIKPGKPGPSKYIERFPSLNKKWKLQNGYDSDGPLNPVGKITYDDWIIDPDRDRTMRSACRSSMIYRPQDEVAYGSFIKWMRNAGMLFPLGQGRDDDDTNAAILRVYHRMKVNCNHPLKPISLRVRPMPLPITFDHKPYHRWLKEQSVDDIRQTCSSLNFKENNMTAYKSFSKWLRSVKIIFIKPRAKDSKESDKDRIILLTVYYKMKKLCKPRRFRHPIKIKTPEESFYYWLETRQRKKGGLKDACEDFSKNVIAKGQRRGRVALLYRFRNWLDRMELRRPKSNVGKLITAMKKACYGSSENQISKLSLSGQNVDSRNALQEGSERNIMEEVKGEIRKYKTWLKKSSQSGELKKVCQTIALTGSSSRKSSAVLLDEFLQWIKTLYALAPENKYFTYGLAVFKNMKKICETVNTSD